MLDWVQYLINFGWADAAQHPDDYKAAADLFKMIFKIGSDQQMLRAMELPRCGCSDQHFRRGAGTPKQAKWNKKLLTINVTSRPPYLDAKQHDDCVIAAARTWSQVCDIKFDLVSSATADITVFYKAIDGPSNTLGFTYLPMGQSNLPLQLDTGDRFYLPGNRTPGASPLLTTLAHELGHCLGLEHGGNGLMAPFLNASLNGPQPGYETDEVVARYGLPVPGTPTPDPTPGGSTDDDIVTIKVPRKYLVIDGYRVVKFNSPSRVGDLEPSAQEPDALA